MDLNEARTILRDFILNKVEDVGLFYRAFHIVREQAPTWYPDFPLEKRVVEYHPQAGLYKYTLSAINWEVWARMGIRFTNPYQPPLHLDFSIQGDFADSEPQMHPFCEEGRWVEKGTDRCSLVEKMLVVIPGMLWEALIEWVEG